MVLLHGKLERFLEPGAGIAAPVETDESLAEEDARHHPIRLFPGAGGKVINRLGRPTFGQQGLGQAETEEFVLRLPLHERGELLHPGHFSIEEQRDAGRVVEATAFVGAVDEGLDHVLG